MKSASPPTGQGGRFFLVWNQLLRAYGTAEIVCNLAGAP